MSSKVTFGRQIQIACLPRTTKYKLSSLQTIYGVGWDEGTEIQTDRNLILNNINTCNQISNRTKNWNTEVCLSARSTLSCKRNIAQTAYISEIVDIKRRFTLVGITSYDSECSKTGNPT